VQRLVQGWPLLQPALAARLLAARHMQERLRAVGAAAHPADLGIALPTLAADHRRARLIRRRFTLLDLLEEVGWLDLAIAELFSPTGFWGLQAAAAAQATAFDTTH
jgi:glycerol-1-phosphate dehydrogenase [NAD(P)+]